MALTTISPNPSRKRKVESMSGDSDSDVSPPVSKRSSNKKLEGRKTSGTSGTTTCSATELTNLSHAELVLHALSLQKRLDAKSTGSSAKELTPQELAKKVENLRTLMERQIRKSMTWKPTCKEGRATFSQDFIVQSEEVFRALFKPVTPEGSKAWKMKKFSVDDFERVVGQGIEASARYNYLRPTSDITVRWDAENGTMKCSGKYGK